jgi:hypothetical protein
LTAIYIGSEYTNPILQPWAADVVKKHGEISLAGQVYPTPSNQCWPGGVPYVFWDFLLQIFQQPDHILMIYRQGHELRHVRMNEPHPAQVTPSWYGDSVGHYEGDTLVIDTVGIKVGPFAMVPHLASWPGIPLRRDGISSLAYVLGHGCLTAVSGPPPASCVAE